MRRLIYSTSGSGFTLVIVFLVASQIQASPQRFDLKRLNVSTLAAVNATVHNSTGPNESLKTVINPVDRKEPLVQLASIQATSRTIAAHQQLDTSDAKSPPVYMSAPKQIRGLQEIRAIPSSGLLGHSRGAGHETTQGVRYEKSGVLPKRRAARGGKPKRRPVKKVIKKKYNRKRIVVVRRKKKQQPKRRIVKINRKPKRRVAVQREPQRYREQHKESIEERSYGGAGGSGSVSAPSKSKYYEYRSVPSKGAWKFGFKRGNDKHAVQRKEHGHKSHFKTEVKWTDKEGKGHQLFDYNHGDHRKGHDNNNNKWGYGAAAAGTKPIVAHQPEASVDQSKGRQVRRSKAAARQIQVVEEKAGESNKAA